jgi:hypothetical protein
MVTKRYDELQAGDVLSTGGTVLHAGPTGPAQPDSYSRRNPKIEVEVAHPRYGKRTFRKDPDATVEVDEQAS